MEKIIALPESSKTKVLQNLKQHFLDFGFTIAQEDFNRPWGGFLVINESQINQFIEQFFPDKKNQINSSHKLSPKILMVAPGHRLSWQYHHRRSEWWRVVFGKIAVGMSETDNEEKINYYSEGQIIQLPQSTRHRLIGLTTWGVVAEIWEHTDPAHPSDEEDIIRLQDDYQRN